MLLSLISSLIFQSIFKNAKSNPPSQLQKNFQYTLIFIFYHQSKYLLITQLSSIFYFLFSLFYCLYCTKRKTTVKHFLFPFLFLSIRLSTVIFCFFFRTISHFAYNNCSPVDAIRIHLFTMPRKDVKKRLFLSNSCIDNSGQNWYTRVKMSDTISSRLNYSIKLSNRAVTPPPSMWLLARTSFPISHQNGVFLRLCCHFCILYLFGMSLDFSSYDCKKI